MRNIFWTQLWISESTNILWWLLYYRWTFFENVAPRWLPQLWRQLLPSVPESKLLKATANQHSWKLKWGMREIAFLQCFHHFFLDLGASWHLQVWLHNKKYHQIIAKAYRIQRNYHQKQPEGRTQFPALTPLSQQGAREEVSWLPVAPSGGLAGSMVSLEVDVDLVCENWVCFERVSGISMTFPAEEMVAALPPPPPTTTTRTCCSLLTHPCVTPICDLAPEEFEELLHLALHPISFLPFSRWFSKGERVIFQPSNQDWNWTAVEIIQSIQCIPFNHWPCGCSWSNIVGW